MNNKMLLLTDAFSRRILAYALLLDERHQKAETALSNTNQAANVEGLKGFKTAIARYEITDTACMDSSVDVEQGSEEAFSRRMQSYISRLDAIQRPDITCLQLV